MDKPITLLDMRQQAAIEGVTLTMIRIRVARTGSLETVKDPPLHEDGNRYFTAAMIKQKALEDKVSITSIKQRIRAFGSMQARKPLPQDASLIEYIAARDGVTIKEVHARIHKYGNPETTNDRGDAPSPEVIADVEHMLSMGVELRVAALKYYYTPKQLEKWLKLGGYVFAKKEKELPKALPKRKLKRKKYEVAEGKKTGRPKGVKDAKPRKLRGEHPSEVERKEKISMTKQRKNWLRACEDKNFRRRRAGKIRRKANKIKAKFNNEKGDLS